MSSRLERICRRIITWKKILREKTDYSKKFSDDIDPYLKYLSNEERTRGLRARIPQIIALMSQLTASNILLNKENISRQQQQQT